MSVLNVQSYKKSRMERNQEKFMSDSFSFEKYVQFIMDSILMNYKSWLVLFICLYWIQPANWMITFMSFFAMMFFSHIFHYMCHWKYSYPYNIVHLYHHSSSHMFSHVIQQLLEFVSILSMLYMKKIIGMNFINDWVIGFFYLFYTSIHNVNYSIFHVNHVHEIHHQVFLQNLGPDICDLILGTKYCPEEGVENTDHYIPNILICFSIIMILKRIWNRLEQNQQLQVNSLGWSFYNSCYFLLFLVSIYLCKKDWDHYVETQQIEKELWNQGILHVRERLIS